jgi:hypothetical protein
MRRDQVLVTMYLDEYNKSNGVVFEVKEWPEQIERNKPAVEAVAVNENGETLAIEHTLLQGFAGEKEDSNRFLKVVGSLEKEPSLRLPDYMIDLTLQVGAIPNGVDWSTVRTTLAEWLKASMCDFPVGVSSAVVPNLSFELKIGIHKIELKDDEGKIFFSRYEPADSLSEVVKTALSKKIQKLIDTDARKRILLFEKDGLLHGYNAIHETIAHVAQEFPGLRHLDEIWLLGTAAWESEKRVNFARVWPDLAFSRGGILRIVRSANSGA